MSVDVLLISMPWSSLAHPSIQLGILKRVLEQDRIKTQVRSYNLALMEHFAAQSQNSESRITVSDYVTIAVDFCTRGLGEWIFAVPPFREMQDADDQSYYDYLRASGASEATFLTARRMRDMIPGFLKSCADDILKTAPRIIGFTTGFNQTVPALTLSKFLKQLQPSFQIIFGGADCDGPMGAALLHAFPWIDVVVRGEGEAALLETTRALLSGEHIKPVQGLCYRREGQAVVVDRGASNKLSMDEVPVPDYDEYFSHLEVSSLRADLMPVVELTFESSRGCWWGQKAHCTFCGINGLDMTFRSKHPERLVDELVTLSSRYRWHSFMATDAILDMDYFRTVLPKLNESEVDFRIFYETKSNLKKNQLYLMRAAGVTQIQPGIESLSTTILKHMRKGVSALQNLRLLKWCREIGISVLWNIIYGFPGEPPQEYERMAELVKEISHFQPPSLIPLVIDRFSPYFDRPHEYGLKITGPPAFFPLVFPPADSVTSRFDDLAYRFEYEHVDSRNPQLYIGGLRQRIEEWVEIERVNGSRLRYLRGPGFLTIIDERKHLPQARYTLEGADAAIYLGCDAGASVASLTRDLAHHSYGPVSPDSVQSLLDELVALRLMYHENGQYLSLAIPELPERVNAALRSDNGA